MLSELRSLAVKSWFLEGDLHLSTLGIILILFEFEEGLDVDMVLSKGLRQFKDKFMHLDRWAAMWGYFLPCIQAKETWVRLVEMPLHLWDTQLFKRVGEAYGGFMTP